MRNRIKTPLLLQMEATECGAAALGSVLGYYGKHLPLEELRQRCGISRNGSNAGNVLIAAEQAGLRGGGYMYSAEELKRVEPPAILHWGFHHFLVFEGYDEKKDVAYLNDPASGHRAVGWAEFESNYTGVALVLRPGEDFVRGGARENVWKRLLSSLSDNYAALAFVLLIGLGLSVVNLFVPIISQIFLDEVITYKHRGWLFDVLLALLIALALKSALLFLRSWCLLRWQGDLTIRRSSGFLAHVLSLPIDFFQQRYAGEIAARVQFNETIASFVTGRLAAAVLDIAVALGYLTLLWLYNAKLTLISLVFTAMNVAVTCFTFRWLTEQQMKLQQETGKLYGLSVAGISVMETLKANGNEMDFFVKWADCNAGYLQMSQQREYYGQYISFVPGLLSGVNAALIMAAGGFDIMDGFMTVGVFVAFQSLMSSFQKPVQNLVNLTQTIQQTQAQMAKVDDVLRYDEERRLGAQSGAQLRRLSGQFELRNVSFGYSKLDKPLLKKLNVRIEPGRRVAVVGRSGSGKSTAAKLAAGLYRPWSGEVLFDGVDAEQIPREVLANSVAMVEQDIFLFKGTVAENIALFDPGIPRADIVQAARDAQIHEDILNLNGGYDAEVDEGGYNFSGGQRQRLEIARALATQPSLLIFDEATSALDPLAEKEIMQNIRRRGCACLIVAHRLSTVRDCDEIIVLHKGRVVQRGRHEELMAVGGHYKKLIES